MGEQTRQTLRGFFRAGQLPTEDHFADLVDSMLNMKDEGFRKSAAHGLEVSSQAGHQGLLSFFRDRDPTRPLWTVAFGREGDRLQVESPGARSAAPAPPALTLHREPGRPVDGRPAPDVVRVGVLTEDPAHALDVGGVVASQGRVGTFDNRDKAEPVLADGQFHTLVGRLRGCQAFEVVAGVGGGRGSGRFALMHAIAMNTHNPLTGWLDILRPRRGIRTTHAFYGRACDRLELRWEGTHGKDAEYALRIRTRCNYMTGGTPVHIRWSVTRLWFDENMDGSAGAPP